MLWKEQAKNRFSFSKDAHKWRNLYNQAYLSVEALSFRQRRDRSVTILSDTLKSDANILDLGCGSGPVLKALLDVNKDYRLTGVDYSADMLSLARENLADGSVTLQQGDCEDTPFADASFDAVVCLGVISYAESIAAALQEIERILIPGGIALVSYRNLKNKIWLDPLALLKWTFDRSYRSKMIHSGIGRSLLRKEVIALLKENTQLSINDEIYIGFGDISLNNIKLSDGKLARFRNLILDLLTRPRALNALRCQLSDIHLLVLRKYSAEHG